MSDEPVRHTVSAWPGWSTPFESWGWPPGTWPGQDIGPGAGDRQGEQVGSIRDARQEQAWLAGGGPKWAGPDARPGGPDLHDDGMDGGFRIYGTL
jgi:hypothetical protein